MRAQDPLLAAPPRLSPADRERDLETLSAFTSAGATRTEASTRASNPRCSSFSPAPNSCSALKPIRPMSRPDTVYQNQRSGAGLPPFVLSVEQRAG